MQFFDTPVTRAWVADTLVRPWTDKVNPGQATDAKWEQGEGANNSLAVADLDPHQFCGDFRIQYLSGKFF